MANSEQSNSEKIIKHDAKPGQDDRTSGQYEAGLVSVIIPTYNRAALVGRAIQSVLDQTYQNFEIIVVDDGSTDNTEEVVSNLEDGRIRYVKLKGNCGAPFARNHGAKVANGEYISLLDSDDYYLPDKLTLQVEAFKTKPEAGLVYSKFFIERYDTKKRTAYGPKSVEFGYLFKKILSNSAHCRIQTWLVRRECFLSIGGFDEALPMLQDRDFIVRFAYHYKILGIPDMVAVIIFHKGVRISHASANIKEYAYNRVLNKASSLAKDADKCSGVLKKVTSRCYCTIAKAYLIDGKLSRARHYSFAALSLNPLNYRVYLYLLCSFNNKLYHLMKKARQITSKSLM